MNSWTRTVSSKGQITLPVELRRRLGLKKGDKLLWEVVDGGIRAHSARKASELLSRSHVRQDKKSAA